MVGGMPSMANMPKRKPKALTGSVSRARAQAASRDTSDTAALWIFRLIGTDGYIQEAPWQRGQVVSGVPVNGYPPEDASSRAARACVDILRCDGL